MFREFKALKIGKETTVLNKDIKKGDIIKLYLNDQITADMILIKCSSSDTCYVDASNFNGQSQLIEKEFLFDQKTEF